MEQFKTGEIVATAYQADASDAVPVREAVARIPEGTHPGLGGAVDGLARWRGPRRPRHRTPEDVTEVFGIGVSGLLACTQAALDDLTSSPDAAILIANGALARTVPRPTCMRRCSTTTASPLEKAAKSKLVGILAERLRDQGIYVVEVTIAGSVKGTTTAMAGAIDPARVADLFWSLTRSRDTTRVYISE